VFTGRVRDKCVPGLKSIPSSRSAQDHVTAPHRVVRGSPGSHLPFFHSYVFSPSSAEFDDNVRCPTATDCVVQVINPRTIQSDSSSPQNANISVCSFTIVRLIRNSDRSPERTTDRPASAFVRLCPLPLTSSHRRQRSTLIKASDNGKPRRWPRTLYGSQSGHRCPRRRLADDCRSASRRRTGATRALFIGVELLVRHGFKR